MNTQKTLSLAGYRSVWRSSVARWEVLSLLNATWWGSGFWRAPVGENVSERQEVIWILCLCWTAGCQLKLNMLLRCTICYKYPAVPLVKLMYLKECAPPCSVMCWMLTETCVGLKHKRTRAMICIELSENFFMCLYCQRVINFTCDTLVNWFFYSCDSTVDVYALFGNRRAITVIFMHSFLCRFCTLLSSAPWVRAEVGFPGYYLNINFYLRIKNLKQNVLFSCSLDYNILYQEQSSL